MTHPQRCFRHSISSGTLCLVVQYKFIDVSEEHIPSIFWVEEYATQATKPCLLFNPEDGGICSSDT
jgi:hypothetical protein